MAKHLSTIFCEHVIIDQDNMVSIVKMIEEVNVPEMPEWPVLVPIKWGLLTVWERTDLDVPEEEFNTRHQLIAPQNERLAQADTLVNLSESQRIRVTQKSAALPVGGPGIHRHVISRQDKSGKWRKVGEYRFRVNVAQET